TVDESGRRDRPGDRRQQQRRHHLAVGQRLRGLRPQLVFAERLGFLLRLFVAHVRLLILDRRAPAIPRAPPEAPFEMCTTSERPRPRFMEAKTLTSPTSSAWLRRLSSLLRSISRHVI